MKTTINWRIKTKELEAEKLRLETIFREHNEIWDLEKLGRTEYEIERQRGMDIIQSIDNIRIEILNCRPSKWIFIKDSGPFESGYILDYDNIHLVDINDLLLYSKTVESEKYIMPLCEYRDMRIDEVLMD